MHKRRLLSWITLLSVAMMVVAGCAPRATSGVTSAQPGTESLVVDLPALVIDFDVSGNPSVGNVPLAQLANTFAPGALDTLVLPSDMVAFMTESNIQHLQIDNTPSGLLLLVNGEPIPSIKWDGQTLQSTAGLVNELGAGVPVLEQVLPLVANLGLGVIVRFPVDASATVIPTYVEGGPSAMAAQEAQQRFLSSVDNAPATMQIPVFYDSDGGWRVGDLTDAEWSSLTSLPFQAARLDPSMMQSIMNAGITEVSVFTNAEGLHISINGRNLPYIGWADGEIHHVLALAEQLGLWNTLADSGMNPGELIGVVETILPAVQTTNASVNVYFPGSVAAAAAQ